MSNLFDEDLAPVCETATPALAALEWAQTPLHLTLRVEAVEKIQLLVDEPSKPNARLRAAVKLDCEGSLRASSAYR